MANKTLFEHARTYRPLADLIRPMSWEEFEGIEDIDPALINNIQKDKSIPP